MKKTLQQKFIGNKLYLILALGWLALSTTSCTTYTYYSPSSGSFSGTTSFCTGGVSSSNTFTYNQCPNSISVTGFFPASFGVSTGTVQWYYNTTGSPIPASSTPLGTATTFTSPAGGTGTISYTPLTSPPGTLYYFADIIWTGANYCTTEYITPVEAVTVATTVSPITGGVSSLCAGGTTSFSDLTGSGTWSTDNPTVATINSSGVVTSLLPGTVNIDYTVGSCTLYSPLTVNFEPPAPVVSPTVTTVCNGSSSMLTSVVAPSLTNLVPVNSFESGVPGTGWTTSGALAADLSQQTASASANPTVSAAEDGSYFLWFDSYDYGTGNANVISPSFSLVGDTGGVITFWFYRDYGSAYTTGYTTEGLTVEINTSTTIGTATSLGFVPREAETATTGSYISGISLPTASGWYPYTCTIPSSYAGYTSATNYVFFHFHSALGDNCYLDNVSIKAYVPTAAPLWSPTAYLFTDPAFTTPYIAGTSTFTVYAHPTTVTTTTVETYTATETVGTCSSFGTSTVTIYDPNATISGTSSICSGGSTSIVFSGGAGSIVSYNINGGATYTVALSAAGTATVSTGILYASATYNLLGVVTGACSATLSGSAVVTVNPPLSNITGDSSICFGAISTLSATPTGGTWSIVGTAIATIDPVSGTFTGVTNGAVPVTYTAPSTGCLSTTTITIFALPLVYTMTGTGTVTYCAGSAGLDIGLNGSDVGISYQLYNGSIPTGPAVPGTGGVIDFGYQGVAGTYSISATNITTSCTNNMYGTANVIINTLPIVYNITGGGAYCAGSTGVDIGLSGSQTFISYQLYNGSATVGSPLAGASVSPLDFGIMTVGGTYTVLATNTITGCTSVMADSAVVVVNPLPGVYSVTGGGSYCAGSTGVEVGLSGSASGINYKLYNGAATVGSAVAGSGAAFNFGIETAAGTYTVLAQDATTGCTNPMSAEAIVIVNPVPVVYNVTGGGSYCAGNAGVLVGLSGSQSGISYQLYNGASTIGTAVAGTGSAITFGYQTAAGTYTVIATNISTFCVGDMDLSATVIINPLPTVYTVSGGGTYCSGGAGFNIYLSGSEIGINYQLFNGSTAVGVPVAGTGSGLDFGTYAAGGTYSVVATNAISLCPVNMAGNATIIVNPLPVVYDVTGGGIYCFGGTGVPVGLSGSETGINYQLFNGTASSGSPVAGTGATVSFGPQSAAGTYTVYATNATTGCVNSMSGAVSVVIDTFVSDSISITTGPTDTVCTGSTVTYIAAFDGGGASPAFAWSVNGTTVSTASYFYTYTPLNGDVVSVTLASDYPCAVPAIATYSTAVTVLPYGYPSVSIASTPIYSVCEGSPVTFTPSPLLGGYSPVYTWFVNGSIDSTGATFTYNPVNYDIVSCILNSDYQCRLGDSATSNNLVMNVHNLLIPTVDIIAIPSTILSYGQTDTLIAEVNGGGADPVYQWYIGNAPVAGATSDTFISNVFTNNDSVTCVVTNSGTCAGVQTYNWVHINEYAVMVKQVGTPGSDIRLLPNPNKGTFTINGNWGGADNEDATAVITDIFGQVIYKGAVKTSQGAMNEQISLGSMPANGVYMLSLTRGDESKVFHFVIEQ